MAIDYTTSKLVESVRRRGSIPASQQLFSIDDIIDLATDELETSILPQIMSVREEYFVSYTDVAVASSSEPVDLDIPSNAIGQKLRDVCWVHTNGSLSSIPRYELEQASGNSYSDDYARTNGFMIRGNNVVLYPSNQGTGTLRLYFYKRPLTLIANTKCGQVQSIDTNTNEVTLSFLPANWAVTNTVNVISQTQPFQTKVDSVEITTISFSTVTLASVDNIAVGDWIALEGYSPIPQLPVEAHKVLAQATVVKCMEAMGDREGMKASQAKLDIDLQNMFKLIAPRVDGAPKKVTNAGDGIFDVGRRNNINLW